MDLRSFFSMLMNLSTLVFVLTSMLAMGLSLTMSQIFAPLRNTRLVIAALAANFLLAPALAYGIGIVLPLSDGLRFGLILVSTAAGAPFLVNSMVTVARSGAVAYHLRVVCGARQARGG